MCGRPVKIPCPICDGRGSYNVEHRGKETCYKCHGTRKIDGIEHTWKEKNYMCDCGEVDPHPDGDDEFSR